MTTVINNPGNAEPSDAGVSIIIGIVVLLVAVGLFFVYALPAIRGANTTPQTSSIDINVKLPPEKTSAVLPASKP